MTLLYFTSKMSYWNKKSYTCEEGGTHLRISAWHLSTNLKKDYYPLYPLPHLKIKKIRILKKWKKIAGDIILHTSKHQTTIIWGMVLELMNERHFFFLFWVIYSPAIRTLMTSLLCLQQRPKEVTITWCFWRPLSNTHKIEQKIKKTHEKTKEKYNLHIHKEYASLPPGITLWKCISTWP